MTPISANQPDLQNDHNVLLLGAGFAGIVGLVLAHDSPRFGACPSLP